MNMTEICTTVAALEVSMTDTTERMDDLYSTILSALPDRRKTLADALVFQTMELLSTTSQYQTPT